MIRYIIGIQFIFVLYYALGYLIVIMHNINTEVYEEENKITKELPNIVIATIWPILLAYQFIYIIGKVIGKSYRIIKKLI